MAKAAGRMLRGVALPALGGLGLLAWSVAVPRPIMYVAGLLLVLPVVVLATVHLLPGRRSMLRWTAAGGAGVLVAALAVGVPQATLAAQTHGDVRWTVSLERQPSSFSELDVWLVGDRVYLSGEDVPLRAYGRASGRLLATYPAALHEHTAVAADGSVAGWDGERVTYYDPDGKQLWAKPFKGRISRGLGSMPVAAADGGTVVLADCDNPFKPAQGCNWTGVGRDGRTVWRQHDDGHDLREWTELFKRTRPVLPSVLLATDGKQLVIRAAADGRETQRVAQEYFDATGVTGDLVLVAVPAGDGCRLTGYRGAGIVFRTEGMPCRGDTLGKQIPGVLRILGQRAYLGKDTNAVTVSLTDGSWRPVSGVDLSGVDDARGALGADVIVYWNDDRLTAVDPATGNTLWQRSGLSTVVAVYVDNGGVFVASRPDGHNPFLSASDRSESAIRVTSLVGRTGEVSGSLLVRNGNAVRARAIGPGESLAVRYDVPDVVLVGTP